MLTLVKNVSRDTLIEICCVAALCRVVMMLYFLDNDATSVNAFYFAGYSQSLSWFFYPRSRLYIAVIVLTDIELYKYKKGLGFELQGLRLDT
jgi:hypothetical protein